MIGEREILGNRADLLVNYSGTDTVLNVRLIGKGNCWQLRHPVKMLPRRFDSCLPSMICFECYQGRHGMCDGTVFDCMVRADKRKPCECSKKGHK